jgi:WD40 repeat protein
MSMALGQPNPYVGLDYFHERHAQYFFGRDDERKRLISNLQAARFTLLYAHSGVGKSSLLRAGVVARLRELAERDVARRGAARHVPVVVSGWRDDPLDTLIEAIYDAAKPLVADGEIRRSDRLDETVEQVGAGSKTTPLVILDQFEDYFLYHAMDATGERFADELARCVQRSDLRVNFLISIREDAYARIGDRFKGRIDGVYANYLHLDYLDAGAAEVAVRGPLERLNRRRAPAVQFAIDDSLVDAVLHQARRHDEGYETAYLQLIMERLWREETSAGSTRLRFETLERLGGAESIVRNHLDEAMSGLSIPEREVAAKAMRYLVTSGGTKIALTATALAEFSGVPEPELAPVLDKLDTARILRPDTSGTGTSYELYHDLLGEVVADWRKSVDTDRERRSLEERLKAEEQRALEEADRRHKDRELGLVRRALVTVSVVVVLLALAVAWALHERGVARAAQEQARSRALAASAVAKLTDDPELSVMLATEAMKTATTSEAAGALRRALTASHVRGRLTVGPTVYASVSDDGAVMSTVSRDTAFLWRPEDQQKLVEEPLGSDSRLVSMAANGTAIAVDSNLKTLILRPEGNGRPVTLERGGQLTWLSLSADGEFAAGRADISAVTRVWETRTGRSVARLPSTLELGTGGFDPTDPRRLILGDCKSESLTVWRWASGAIPRVSAEERHVRSGTPSAACSIAVSGDGARVVEARADGSARLWDILGGRILRSRLDGVDGGVRDVTWSRDSRRFAVAAGSTATVFSASGRQIARSQDHNGTVLTVAFDTSGDRIVTSSNDATARVTDAARGTTIRDLRGHRDWVLDAGFSYDGRWVFTVSADGTAARWLVESGRVLRGHREGVLDAAFSPDGARVMTASADGDVRLWNSTGRRVIRVHGRRRTAMASVASVVFSPDDRELIVAANDARGRGRILFADAKSGQLAPGKEIASLRGRLGTSMNNPPARPGAARSYPHADPKPTAMPALRRLSISPDGEWLVTTSSWQPTRLWDLSRGGLSRVTLPLSFWEWAVTAVYSPDQRWIVTAGYDGVARLFDAETLEVTATLQHPGALHGADFSRDSRRLLTYGADGNARIWDLRQRRPRPVVLRGHSSWIAAGDFSPDGSRVVTGGADKTTRVWDARTGQLLSNEQRHAAVVNSVTFSPDGSMILSASEDGTARLYPCQTCGSTADLARLAARRTYRKFTPAEAREFRLE